MFKIIAALANCRNLLSKPVLYAPNLSLREFYDAHSPSSERGNSRIIEKFRTHLTLSEIKILDHKLLSRNRGVTLKYLTCPGSQATRSSLL